MSFVAGMGSGSTSPRLLQTRTSGQTAHNLHSRVAVKEALGNQEMTVPKQELREVRREHDDVCSNVDNVDNV